jgi:hypothetical protein
MMRCLVLIKISKLWTAINVAAARSLDPKRRSEAILQGRCWRNSRLQPKAGFSRLPPVHKVDLEGRLRVDLTSSPNPRRMAGICAFLPSSLHRLRTAAIPRAATRHARLGFGDGRSR